MDDSAIDQFSGPDQQFQAASQTRIYSFASAFCVVEPADSADTPIRHENRLHNNSNLNFPGMSHSDCHVQREPAWFVSG